MQYLQLSFPSGPYDQGFITAGMRAQATFKEFVTSVQNAPNLQQLTLKEAIVELDDIKLLHDNTPKLVNLKFEAATICTTANVSNQEEESPNATGGQENRSSPLRSFELGFSFQNPIFDNDVLLRDIIPQIRLYLSNNYRNLERFHFYFYGDSPPSVQLVEERVVLETISNLPNLSSYSMKVFPTITQNVLGIFDQNTARLNHLEVWMQDIEQANNQFDLLKDSRLSSSLEKLTIGSLFTQYGINIHPVSSSLTGCLENLSHLKYLKIDLTSCIGKIPLFMDAVRNVNGSLEALHFGVLVFVCNDRDEAIIEQQLSSIIDSGRFTNIKELDIEMKVLPTKAHDSFKSVSDLIAFDLRLYPLLERLHLQGTFNDSAKTNGVDKLDFVLDLRPARHLEWIHICLNGRSYCKYRDGSFILSPFEEEKATNPHFYLKLRLPGVGEKEDEEVTFKCLRDIPTLLTQPY